MVRRPHQCQPGVCTWDPCHRWSAYVKVQGRTWGAEAEWRKHPLYREVRLITPGRTRVWRAT